VLDVANQPKQDAEEQSPVRFLFHSRSFGELLTKDSHGTSDEERRKKTLKKHKKKGEETKRT